MSVGHIVFFSRKLYIQYFFFEESYIKVMLKKTTNNKSEYSSHFSSSKNHKKIKMYISVVGFLYLQNVFTLLIVMAKKKTKKNKQNNSITIFLHGVICSLEKSLPVSASPSDGRLVTTILFCGP